MTIAFLIRPVFHILLHIAAPALIARFCFKTGRLKKFWILLASMAIDLDHLLASPVYDPDRCSIGFHPLHSFWAILAYGLLLFIPKFRIFAIGLLVHIALDLLDCFIMQ